MNLTSALIQEMRKESGLSFRALAERAGTSAPTLSNYERGHIEPKLSTLLRLAEASGTELVVLVVPKLTQAERMTMALHRAVASKLLQNRDRVVRIACKNLAIQRKADTQGRSKEYFDAWESLLKNDEGLLEILTSTSRRARELRPASPFAGVLSDEERLEILQAEFDRELSPVGS